MHSRSENACQHVRPSSVYNMDVINIADTDQTS